MPHETGVVLPHGWTISPSLMPCWRIDDDHTLELAAAGRTDDHRIQWSYRLARKKRTIFAACDIRSGVGARYDTAELISAARTVLGFLTLRPGDTDADYFDGYTRAQVAWRDAYAEDLSLLAMDDMCGYCGSDLHLSPGCTDR